MKLNSFVSSRKTRLLGLAVAICVGLCFLVYFLVSGGQFNKPKQYSKENKEELAELSRIDLIGAVYDYIFNEVLDSEMYEEDPIEAFNASGVAVEDGEVTNV
ncbi:MAG: hypothetical protein U9Q67_01410, partial [Patescibacteria group bacterium]|nr:hypothetical protein [Patescibacteria group bacterium]